MRGGSPIAVFHCHLIGICAFLGERAATCLRSSKGSLSLERSERTTDLERREMDIFKEQVSRLSDRKQALGCHFYLIRNDPDMAT